MASDTPGTGVSGRERPACLPALAAVSVLAALLVAASSSAPTPLYPLYVQAFGLTPVQITVVFAAYAAGLIVALLTFGGLSDYVGRRPVVIGALVVNILSMVVFLRAGSVTDLVFARAIQGFATGVATTALGAAILDASGPRGPLLNSITNYLGLSLGTLGAGALVAFAAAPQQRVYELLLAASLAAGAAYIFMPETAARRPGALRSLRPSVRLPRIVRPIFLRISPLNVSLWALGGFYLSLMPTLVRTVTGLQSPLIGSGVIALLMLVAAASVIVLRGQPPDRLLRIGCWTSIMGIGLTLAGVRFESLGLLVAGTAVAGVGTGTAYSGMFRTLLPLAPPDQKAGLLAAFFLESYAAFAIPVILAGLAIPVWGLTPTTYVYGGVQLVLIGVSLLAFKATALGPNPEV